MSLKGANLEHAKSLNRRVAFESIYRHGPISRTDVANRTQLTPQTVTNIVSELMPHGLIIERSLHTGKKGKPARQYEINRDGIVNIGLHIDQHRIVGRLTNVIGETISNFSTKLVKQDPDYVESCAEAVIEALLQGDESLKKLLLGVGVAMPGVFSDGVFISDNPLTMKGWANYPLANSLSKKIGLPVFVENDATTAAIGEGLFGAAKNSQSFVYFYFGLGLGGGLLINGAKYSGAHNRSAEIGHIIVEPGGMPCPCGNEGCLERYVSLFSAYQAIMGTNIEYSSVSREAVQTAFNNEAPSLIAWIKSAAKYLSTGVNIIENVLDPERIFMGGLLPEALLSSLIKETERHRMSNGLKPTLPESNRLKLEVVSCDVSLGAAALPLYTLLNPPSTEHTGLDYIRPTEGKSLYNLLTGN